nr:reverse transcriptase domain-containing protein [Tanacetum cinerariifolium]
MSADSAVTYTSVHSEAQSWSIPSEDPYEEATQQLFEQAPRSPEYVPRDHVPVFVPEFKHPEDLVPAEGPTMAHGVDCSYMETRLQDTERRMMAALELVNRRDRAAVRAEIEVLRSERLAYEQEGIQTREALARSEAHCWALEARVAVLETHARRLEWQRQAADDFVVEHIMRNQALEAGAHIDTLKDTGSFNAIIGMDWLRRHHVMIMCNEKLVRVLFGNETVVFRGAASYIERESRLTVTPCSKVQEYWVKGCHVFLAQISATQEDYKPEGKQVKDVPIVQDFPEVFPENLPRPPPARPVEFQIDLILGVAPVARAPYCNTPKLARSGILGSGRDGEKDSITASEFLELSSFGGQGDELPYKNISTRRISSSGSKSASSISGEIKSILANSPENSSRRESNLREETIEVS